MAISLAVGLTVAAVFTDTLTVPPSGSAVAASLGMVSDGSWRAVAPEPVLLPRVGMVHFLTKPCGGATQGKLKFWLDPASRFSYQSGGGSRPPNSGLARHN